jgi:hypothetical protein
MERVMMTRDLAEKLLGINADNRNVRPRGVGAYAADMGVDSDWMETGDTIKVSDTNILVDGQHRLLAFLRACESKPSLKVPMWIAWGVDERARDYVDSGIKRLLADQLKWKRHKHPHALAATLRITYAWEVMGERRGLGNQGQATTATLLRFLDKHPELVEITEQAVNDASKSPLTPSVLSLTRWLFDQIDANESDGFFEALTTDRGELKGDPIWELRKAARRLADTPDARRSQAKLVALTIKAWNMWREGKTLGDTGLSFKMGGASPEKFPEPM